MADKPNNNNATMGVVITAVVGGLIALMFAGSQQSAKNQQTNIDQLPALQQRIATLEAGQARHTTELSQIRESERIDYANLRESIAEIQRVQAQQLDRDALQDAFQSLRDALEALEGQLNRRIQLEVKDPIYSVLEELSADIDDLDHDAEDNENKIVSVIAKVEKLEAMIDCSNNASACSIK